MIVNSTLVHSEDPTTTELPTETTESKSILSSIIDTKKSVISKLMGYLGWYYGNTTELNDGIPLDRVLENVNFYILPNQIVEFNENIETSIVDNIKKLVAIDESVDTLLNEENNIGFSEVEQSTLKEDLPFLAIVNSYVENKNPITTTTS